MTDKPIELNLDSRRRCSLKNIGRHQRYIATWTEDGVITLRPAKLVLDEDEP